MDGSGVSGRSNGPQQGDIGQLAAILANILQPGQQPLPPNPTAPVAGGAARVFKVPVSTVDHSKPNAFAMRSMPGDGVAPSRGKGERAIANFGELSSRLYNLGLMSERDPIGSAA